MIELKGLTKIFPSGLRAVDGLDLTINAGEIFALLGPNGAGKTTTIRVMSTISGFDEGSVRIAGYDVDKDPQKVREAIGVVAQQTGIDYFLTGRENLVLQGRLYRMKRADIDARIDELGRYFELHESLDRLVSTYSGGMRRKLDIACALIHRPRLVFLDEPTLGLDIKSRQSLWSYIEKLNREFNLTILLTTHYLEEADSLAHRVAIINLGKIQVIGTPAELKHSVQGDSVVLEFAADDPQAGAFAAAIRQESFVSDVVWEADKLHLYVDSGAERVPRIMQAATEHGATVRTLSLAEPTLDDVFLKYTGSSISGTAGETTDEWWKQWAGKGGGSWNKQWQADAAEPAAGAPDTQDTQDWQKWQQGGARAGGNESGGAWQADGTGQPDRNAAPDASQGNQQQWPSDKWPGSGDWKQRDKPE